MNLQAIFLQAESFGQAAGNSRMKPGFDGNGFLQAKKLHACRLAPFLKANKPDHTLHAGLQAKARDA